MPSGLYKLSVAERIKARVRIDENGCWIWTAARFPDGYGLIGIGGRNRGAHRVSYEIAKGPICSGLQLDHLCRNRACVNPDHLEPITQKANILRGVGWGALNARKTHCPKGHEYSERNTRVDGGRRYCRECDRLRSIPRNKLKSAMRKQLRNESL